jgi:hypothetical protein
VGGARRPFTKWKPLSVTFARFHPSSGNVGWGAIAIDGKNVCGPHGYAVAARLGEAQNTALRQCYQYGGKDCVIRAWACDAKG